MQAGLKGKRGEYHVRDMLREYGYKAERTPLSGAIPGWREDITSPMFPFAIEVKNRESWAILDWYKDAESKETPKPTLLVATKNNEDYYCFLRLSDLLMIMQQKIKQPIAKPDKTKKLSLEETSGLQFSKKQQTRRAK